MATNQETLHLLIHTQSQNDAEGIVSLLRNSGNATRAHQISSLEDLDEQLEQKSWDLLIAEDGANGVHYPSLQERIRRLNKDLPIILISKEIDLIAMENALRHGVCSVVPRDESNLMVLAIQRELRHLKHRRELRSIEVRLRDAEKRAQALLESSRDAVAYVHDGMHIFANPSYLSMFGYSSVDELEGMPLMDMVDSSGQSDFKRFFKKYLNAPHKESELSTLGVDGDGQLFPMQMNFSPASYAEERCTMVTIHSHAKNTALEDKLRKVSNIDMMTGLYNKPYFIAQLEIAVDNAVLGGSNGAIIYMNIDGFGKIKSEVGISRADTVLSELSQSLKKTIGSDHSLARISEDIFATILTGYSSDQAMKLAEQLRSHVEGLLIDLGDRTITVTTSIGVALINDTCSRPEDVLQNAHTASEQVHQQPDHHNGNGVMLFVPDIPEDVVVADVSIEEAVTDALRQNSFQLLFQPKISLRGEDVEHYEALMQLPLADGRCISSDELMNNPDINEGLKRKVDRWVLLNTLKQLGEHRQQGHNSRVFVNLATPSIQDDSLPNWISVAMRAARLPKGSLVIQLAEDSATRVLKQAQHFVSELNASGITTALNHFGCSLNPLRTLQHLAVEYVKLDGSYTSELGQSPENQQQLQTLLTALHEAEKKTVIPMVDSASTLASLWQMGVHFVQGDYVQAPQSSMNYNFEEESSF
ncbi:EAL domain-containing protein [Oceanobacter sp. 5_MG-2023]|uniref:EAL domain-containing response regulator n=1 Tax=Oceanobacter sp. 5_MG-2023 TaxID=3062645 RepID=UPI0026E429CA|nr:EAL domain-containing protein [Oceanobacter sp. 5_MG-2023]MDO6682355.1 EAL domain-containing protein [Oceanobacter sp. 5_MG-2023]